jgi:thiamine-monophosphate kinase
MEAWKLGERRLIDVVRRAYDYAWAESDSAFFDLGRRRVLITNDSITQSTHIPNGAKPEDAGYFFAAINLSDIAAMGGRPLYFMSSIIIPAGFDTKYLIAFEKGVRRCLDSYGAKVIGGDLKKGREFALTGIAIGEVERSRMMCKLNMKEGEALCVTGELGRNAAGYYYLRMSPQKGAAMLLDVEPKIREGMFLSANGIRAATDLSDGVYSSVYQLNRSLGVGFEIDYASIPVSEEARVVNKRQGISIEQMCLNFGGDYQLMFSVDEKVLDGLKRKAAAKNIKITRIGTLKGRRNVLVSGSKRIYIRKRGYEHFISD